MKLARLVLLSGLAACVVGPETPEPELDLPADFTRALDLPQAERLWWEGFSDPTLDRLVARSLDRNLSVRAADARLARAEALARAERSDLFPRIDGAVTAAGAAGDEPGYEGALVGAWTPDLFGDRRRELRAARADLLGAEASVENARRITASALAATYVELRRVDAQIALLRQSLDLQRQTLRIVRLRAEAGLAADLDVQRAAGDLARTRAQSGPFDEARARAAYAINVLVGRAPTDALFDDAAQAEIPHYAAGPQAGVPADLIRRRPDIRAAEARLVAAAQRVGAERADLYPSFDLSGVITTDLAAGDIVSGAVKRITATLDVPLLDGGRRLAEVRAARAAAEEALADYELAILTALEETEGALIAIEAAEQRRADLEAAVDASEIAFDQLQALYKEGLATLIDVLDAQRQLIGSREAFTNSDAAVARAYVELYTALGAPTRLEAATPGGS